MWVFYINACFLHNFWWFLTGSVLLDYWGDAAQDVSMHTYITGELYSPAEGKPVIFADTFNIRSNYECTTDQNIESLGVAVVGIVKSVDAYNTTLDTETYHFRISSIIRIPTLARTYLTIFNIILSTRRFSNLMLWLSDLNIVIVFNICRLLPSARLSWFAAYCLILMQMVRPLYYLRW